MSAARICLMAAAILGLNACTGRGDIPQPSASNGSAGAAAVPGPLVKTPPPQAASKVSPPVARTPAKTPAPIARGPQTAALPAASLTLDLNALTKQLKATKAIGLFGKIALKNQVDDLLSQFRKYYKGKAKITLQELQVSYNLLMMKVLSLVQDEDQQLASAIVFSRDAIWALLTDPVKFATLDI